MLYVTDSPQLTARALVAGDWREFRDIRLEAIKEDKKYFFYMAKIDRTLNNHQWKSLCQKNNHQCMFDLFDGSSLIGISLIRKNHNILLF